MDAVLFDMFGVIARDQSPEGRVALERAAGVAGPDFWSAYWHPRRAYDRGDLDGPAYWTTVSERLGVPFGEEAIRRLIALDVESWSRVDEEMVAFVTGLGAEGTRLGLLSNIPAEIADYFGHHHARVLEPFSVLGLSSRIRRAKPEPEAFEWALERLEVPAERVLFVDDRETNVRAAIGLGLRGHRFTSLRALREHLSGRA
ncbi:HAD family phosphatase [Nocardiopsis sp. FIRDI 009]|uniref:HAD family hydrolase n=1 Tax=Nocardiopsis sp. FIRDI 009 TaxID=714197 RepID=UPI000E27AD6D|nr:HAD family phosphatase [Nocardiopsis sp. FIRDI 009]